MALIKVCRLVLPGSATFNVIINFISVRGAGRWPETKYKGALTAQRK